MLATLPPSPQSFLCGRVKSGVRAHLLRSTPLHFSIFNSLLTSTYHSLLASSTLTMLPVSFGSITASSVIFHHNPGLHTHSSESSALAEFAYNSGGLDLADVRCQLRIKHCKYHFAYHERPYPPRCLYPCLLSEKMLFHHFTDAGRHLSCPKCRSLSTMLLSLPVSFFSSSSSTAIRDT